MQGNGKKTFTVSTWMLVCIEAFSAWQMGVIYYASKAFTVNGVTPLPADVGSTIPVILAAYMIGALLAFLWPRRAVIAAKLLLPLSMLCTAAMFLPLPEPVLAAAFMASVFCCVLFISVDAVLLVCLYASKTAILAAVCSALITAVLTPLMQNDLFEVNFLVFNGVALLIQGLVLLGVSRLPSELPLSFKAESQAQNGEKPSPPPTLLLWGTLLLFFTACVSALFSSTMAESLQNGIAVAYGGCGAGALFFLCLFKRGGNPLQLTTALLAAAALGFLLFLLPYAPIRYAGLALQGAGIFIASLSWVFAGLCFEKWRSKWIVPVAVLLALLAVLVNAGLIELMRGSTKEMYVVYTVVAVGLLLVYFQVKPFYERANNEQADACESGDARAAAKEPLNPYAAILAQASAPAKQEAPLCPALAKLTKREAEVANLISYGYSIGDIAGKLFISDQTVKGHTKSIYRKLEIHSRFELAALINKSERE